MTECVAEAPLLTAGCAADRGAVRVLADLLGGAEAETDPMILDLSVEVEAAVGVMEEDLAAGEEVAEMVITCSHKAKIAAAFLPIVKAEWGIVPSRLILSVVRLIYNG